MAKKVVILVFSALAFWGAYKVAQMCGPAPMPVLDEEAYWGPGAPRKDDTSIKPFKINVPEEVLLDLNHRLDHTKALAPPLEGVNFEYGFNTDTLKKILTFWRKEYKWREREIFLNQFPQFKTQIQGMDVHYIHVKPKQTAKKTLPLLLLHGWPGSIREFYSLIPLLTAGPLEGADFMFEVITPSLPGFGFSQSSSKPGYGIAEMAVTFRKLMKRLGHEKFYVHGGDFGSSIGSILATIYPEDILGYHSNFCGVFATKSVFKLIIGSLMPSLIAPQEHQVKIYPLSNLFAHILEETGYMHLQATKPDTIGVGLTDSPAGLAAYILEKFSTWTKKSFKSKQDGGLLSNKLSKTDLLDNVMIYWVTGSITTSMRLYTEVFDSKHVSRNIDSIITRVPTACIKFKHEIFYIPDSLIREKFYTLIQMTNIDEGGHFAAFEMPEVLARDIWISVVKMDQGIKRKFVIQDLNQRLDRTQTLTPPLEGINFEYGFNSITLKKILTFWRKDYNWKQRQTFLNQFPQFKTQIQGLDVHYIHVKPKQTAKKTLPLLLLHGWPGSIREFYSLIPLLTAGSIEGADFVFEVIAPSLPGYGFSQGAAKPGYDAAQMAVTFRKLMKRLGHDQFYVQGGDWGSMVASILTTVYPETILGQHSNMCGARNAVTSLKMLIGSVMPSLIVEEKYQDRMYPLTKTFSFIMEEMGYFHIQATKPDTIGVALSDSPAGLAAYILEKFSTWTNPTWRQMKDGNLEKKYTYTDLLDNVMIYWVTNSITTSVRLYSEVINKRFMNLNFDGIPTDVPTACARFKYELMYMPDSFLTEKYTNLVQTSDFDDGGHFAAFEMPQILAKDIWTAVVKMEKLRAEKNTKKNK